MARRAAQVLLAVFVLAWAAFFVASPVTRAYALQSLSCGDAAYAYYDDFPTKVQKPVAVFQFLAVVALALLYRARMGAWLRIDARAVNLVFAAGSLCIAFAWPSTLLALTACAVAAACRRKQPNLRAYDGWAVLALAAAALVFRLEKLPNVAGIPLQPDTREFLELAQRTTWFYDSGYREPLLAGIYRVLSWIFPLPADLATEGYLPARLLTLVLSCAVVIAVYGLGRAVFSGRVAFGAAFVLAINKALVYRSLQGLREELQMLGIVLVVWLVLHLTRAQRPPAHRFVALGAGLGLLLLTRTSFLLFILFVLLWCIWDRRLPLRGLAVALLVCLVLAVPFYVACWQTYGDPLYSGNSHMRNYYRFVTGEAPPPDEKVSLVDMAFRVFPWYRSVGFAVEGLFDTLFLRFALRIWYLPASVALIGCSAVGYILWLFRRETVFLLLAFLVQWGPMFFFLGMLNHTDTTFDWRHVVDLFPFAALAGIAGLDWLLARAGFPLPGAQ